MIPKTFKDDLLARVSILSVISPHVRLKKAGVRHYGLCPFHDEKTPSFAVHSTKQFFYCFGCGAKGDAIRFLMDHLGLGFRGAIKQLADAAGMQLPDGSTDWKEHHRVVNAGEILSAAADELTFAYIVMSDLQKWLADESQGQPPGPAVRSRFLTAASRIRAAAEEATGRCLEVERERDEIIAAGILTWAEEVDLRAFPTADFGSLCNPATNNSNKEVVTNA